YYTRTVLLKNGKLLTGLAAGEDALTIGIKRENAVLEVIQKKDIDDVKTEAKSLMPEGLDKNITPPEFRDLIRYLMANPYLTVLHLSKLHVDENAFDKALSPEKGDPLKAEGFEWILPEVGPSGKLQLGFGKPYTKETVQYVYAEVTAPSEIKTRLSLG